MPFQMCGAHVYVFNGTVEMAGCVVFYRRSDGGAGGTLPSQGSAICARRSIVDKPTYMNVVNSRHEY